MHCASMTFTRTTPASLSSSSASMRSSMRRVTNNRRCRAHQRLGSKNNNDRGASVVVYAADGDDPFKDTPLAGLTLGKLMKKVQGAVPVVSLVSKLLTPEGGVGSESLSYNEYCRAKLDAAAGTEYGASLSELCDLHAVEPRQLLLLTWMVYEGNGLNLAGLGGKGDLAMGAARRLSSTGFDYEYEIYRFEQQRDDALAAMKKKGNQRSRDMAPAVASAVEVLELVCGAKNGLTAEGKGHIAVIAEATMTPV